MRLNSVLYAIAATLSCASAAHAQSIPATIRADSSVWFWSGRQLDRIPVDSARSLLKFLPGVRETAFGVSIRGSAEGNEATYINGVPMNSFGGQRTTLPLNALRDISVRSAGIDASRGNTSAGIVDLATGAATAHLSSGLSFETDELSPRSMRTYMNRLKATVAGPTPLAHLQFFGAASALGRRYEKLPAGFDSIPIYIASGIDTIIRVDRSALAANTPSSIRDSVDVIIPELLPFNHGRTSPTNQSDALGLVGTLRYDALARTRLDLTAYYDRAQEISRPLTSLFNPDAWVGERTRNAMVTLGAVVDLNDDAARPLQLRMHASRQSQTEQHGALNTAWMRSHLAPALGFNLSNTDFATSTDAIEVNETAVRASRSRLINAMSLGDVGPAFPTLSTGPRGTPFNLRIGPYGVGFIGTEGVGTANNGWTAENRWYFDAALEWQPLTGHHVRAGAETTRGDLADVAFGLGISPVNVSSYKPTYSSVYLDDNFRFGALHGFVGVRGDRFDPDVELPVTPGVVFAADSLSADRYELPAGATDYRDGLVQRSDCGGTETAARRTNSDGELVCKNNFQRVAALSAISPRVHVAYDVSPMFGVRASFDKLVKAPAVSGALGIGLNANMESSNGVPHGRAVDMPSVTSEEVGGRYLFGQNTMADVALYSRNYAGPLGFRKIGSAIESGTAEFNVLANLPDVKRRGVDVQLQHRFGDAIGAGLTYSYISDSTTGPHAATLLLDINSRDGAGNGIARSITRGIGIVATAGYTSGFRYNTGTNFGKGITVFPSPFQSQGNFINPAPRLDVTGSARFPARKFVDLRLTKDIRVAHTVIQLFADARNLPGITNYNNLFAETSRTTNDIYRDLLVRIQQTNTLLDDDIAVDDIDIRAENTQNAANRYQLLQVERRYGDGDGIFTVAEQRTAFTAFYDFQFGPQWFGERDRQLRLGAAIRF